MFRVLLISLVNWDSLMELPALLSQGGCTVDVFSVKGSWAIQNKFYSKWIEAPEDEGEFVNKILDLVAREGDQYDWMVPGDDIIIRLLNERITDEKTFYKIMPLCNIGNRELLGSKAGFSSLCSKYGIKTPRYLIYEEGMTPVHIGEYMGYPFLMKVDKSEGGFGVFLCDSQQSFEASFAQVKNKENLVFQQFIKGYDVNVEVLYRNGKLLVYNYSRTLKIMGNFGVSTQRLFYQNPSIEPELIKIGADLGVSGFGNVVFMYDENEQTHYLIEVDVRPNAWMYYGRFTGNDFSKAVNNIISGNLVTVRPPQPNGTSQIKINLYKKDVHRCLVEKDIKGLCGWLINRDGCWRYIPFYDGKLLRACVGFLFKSFGKLVTGKLSVTFGR